MTLHPNCVQGFGRFQWLYSDYWRTFIPFFKTCSLWFLLLRSSCEPNPPVVGTTRTMSTNKLPPQSSKCLLATCFLCLCNRSEHKMALVTLWAQGREGFWVILAEKYANVNSSLATQLISKWVLEFPDIRQPPRSWNSWLVPSLVSDS